MSVVSQLFCPSEWAKNEFIRIIQEAASAKLFPLSVICRGCNLERIN
jgi:hypothetical protein